MAARFVLSVAITLAASGVARAQACPPVEIGVVEDPANGVGDMLGSAVATDGELAYVGAPLDDTLGNDTGIVRVLARVGDHWEAVGTIEPADPAPDQRFGSSIAIDADLMVVGAVRDSEAGPGAGAAYVFARDAGAWAQEAKLVHPDAEVDALFGQSVAISTERVLVGAPADSALGAFVGRAFVFDRAGGVWTLGGTLEPTGIPSGGYFGISVALDGDSSLVGAFYLGFEFIPGSAFFFERSEGGWGTGQHVQSLIPTGRDRFGAAVALAGGVAFIGSPLDAPPTQGRLVTFERGDDGVWAPVDLIVSPEATNFDRFGGALALDGQRLLVGAPTHLEAGRVFVFEVDGTELAFVGAVSASDAASSMLYGGAVGLAGALGLVGAPFADVPVEDAGEAYLLDLDPDPPGDFNGDGEANVLDFVAFQTAFVAMDPSADCDMSGTLDILDFVCFQGRFGQDCP